MNSASTNPVPIDENARRRFEQSWQTDTPLTIEAVLPPTDDPAYLATLEELVLIEMELVWKQRSREGRLDSHATILGVEQYLQRFPVLNRPEIAARLAAEDAALLQRFARTPAGPGTANSPGSRALPNVPGYTLLGPLGQGGMGVVYRARQDRLNRIVALKMIRSDGLADAEMRARFQREAEALARLAHPNIVQIHEVGGPDGVAFFSMELVEGGSLAQRLAGTPLTATEAAQMVGPLARAIQAAHDLGILHRDLKPANVLLAEAGKAIPKVTDFGLAKLVTEDGGDRGDYGQTETGQVLGTPSYMAPEQAGGQKNLTPACDVYSLGAILYECLTGRPPFRAATTMDTLWQVLHQEPVPPRSLNARVPRDLETIALKCLAKSPAQRYASAQALADDLDRFLAGRPIQARPVGAGERALKWVRRKPALAGLLLASLVALLALVGVAVALSYSGQLQSALTLAEQQKAEAEMQRKRANEQEALARRYLYLARMSLAYRAAEAGEGAQVIDLLEEYDTPEAGLDDPRGFEWYYLRQTSRHLRTLRGHPGEIQDAAFHPGGKQIASASDDSTVRLWDTDTGQCLQTLKTGGRWVEQVLFDPQGRRLVAAVDKRVIVWQMPEARVLLQFAQHTGSVDALAISPNDEWLASAGSDGTVLIWDSTGVVRTTLRPPGTAVRYLAFRPDGQRLAWCGSRAAGKPGAQPTAEISIRDAATGQEVLAIPTARARGLAWSPDGKQLASGGPDGHLLIWDAETGKEVGRMTAKGSEIRSVAFSPDGGRLAATGSDRVVRLWDVAGRKLLAELRGHRARPRGFLDPGLGLEVVRFDPTGKYLISGGDDRVLRLWDADDRKARPLPATIPAMSRYRLFSADQRRLACAEGNDTITVWDAVDGQEVRRVQMPGERLRPMLFSQDGRLLVVGVADLPVLDRLTKFQVWDLGTGKMVLALQARDPVLRTALSADGRWLALAAHGVLLGDTTTGKKTHWLTGHAMTVYGIGFSPDDRRIASASEDATVKLWDVESGQLLHTLSGHQWGVNAVAFSRDGRLLASGAGDNTVRLWEVETGRPVRTLLGLTPHQDGVHDVAFSPDGRRLLSLGHDNLAKLWDVETGLEVFSIRNQTGNVLTAWLAHSRR